MSLDVYLLPDWTSAEKLAGRIVVVIDVLRATTTITQALSAGAREVIPCLEVAEALKTAAEWPQAPTSLPPVLGGERGGRRIPEFHLGNSPVEFTSDSVADRTVIFTTTNGTRAMELCRRARRVLLGTFNNLSALVAELQNEEDVAILCAGTNQVLTAEDVFLAGALVTSLVTAARGTRTQNDEALVAARAWEGIAHCRDPQALAKSLTESRGGRNLIGLGMADDISFAAQIDTIQVVAELDLKAWRIRRSTR